MKPFDVKSLINLIRWEINFAESNRDKIETNFINSRELTTNYYQMIANLEGNIEAREHILEIIEKMMEEDSE